MEQQSVFPRGMIWPFFLLTFLFFAWALPNNLTDTMLAAFKRIMSLSDSKTAWIQVVCYLLGYGFFAIPGALFIKRYTYKSGVILGLAMYVLGTFLFYPAMKISALNVEIGFMMFLFAIFVLFAGLSILETATNSYVCDLGDPSTATQRLNFTQSFNPFGAITGVIISQVFILSQLNHLNASDRSLLPSDTLVKIQGAELNSVTMIYMGVGAIMFIVMLAFILTKMPPLKENNKNINLKATLGRLMKNKKYLWSVFAQFFYVGAQIAVWSFIIRYVMQQLNFDAVIFSLGEHASAAQITDALRYLEPVAGAFYSFCEMVGLDALLPRTAEQAGATYYILSLVLFVVGRFICTYLMKYIKPRNLLVVLSVTAFVFCLGAIYGDGVKGVYSLMGISFCMSLMFPTIYSFGVSGLGEDTKIGGAGMVMAIAGAAVLTQIQGVLSDETGTIVLSFWVPAIAFVFIAYYAITINKKTSCCNGLNPDFIQTSYERITHEY